MSQPTAVKYVFPIYLNHGIPDAPTVPVRAGDLNNPVFEEAARKTDTSEGEVRRRTLVQQLAADVRQRTGAH